jgi:TonB family protein
MASRAEGIVSLELSVDRDGKVAAARIMASAPQLDAAALDAVQTWEFLPALADGVAMASAYPVSLGFSPRERTAAEQVRVGAGGITEPVKVRNVKPVYPEEAQRARVQGVVIAEAFIARDGTVRDVKILRSAGELLDRATIDAVRQWRYAPTLLNGVPVEVVMAVTTSFTLR